MPIVTLFITLDGEEEAKQRQKTFTCSTKVGQSIGIAAGTGSMFQGLLHQEEREKDSITDSADVWASESVRNFSDFTPSVRPPEVSQEWLIIVFCFDSPRRKQSGAADYSLEPTSTVQLVSVFPYALAQLTEKQIH
ncbi:hypothetical protein R1flu_020331 [Riccia fluitans]|uniref:Uncharacterized protein n=1 Tax=Riccia fluitans TaxID=41844 RepID=A0ABD1ZLG5_9MARC